MKKKIIITAANGFIGQCLVKYFSDNYEVVALVRKLPKENDGVKYMLWDGIHAGEWTLEFEGAHTVINLAGRSVNCRYNEKNKEEIYSSRLESTMLIGKVIDQCADKPKFWLNASSATIYKHSLHEPMTEKEGIIGEGFSVDVCQKWEKQFNDYRQEGVRQVLLRTAIVLGREGGVMIPFQRLVNWGLGGKMAQGNQMFSWIHEEDLCRIIQHLILDEQCSGVYNVAAPVPVTNEVFMRTLRQVKQKAFGIPAPAWLLEAGAWLIGTETELILKSRFVIPERLIQEGFEFKYAQIRDCLQDLTGTQA